LFAIKFRLSSDLPKNATRSPGAMGESEEEEKKDH